jgi:hypothetical protein
MEILKMSTDVYRRGKFVCRRKEFYSSKKKGNSKMEITPGI